MRRLFAGSSAEHIRTPKEESWNCILRHCSQSARQELISEAMQGRWIRNAFLIRGIEELDKSKLPRPLTGDEKKKVYLDPELLGDDVLIRVWVTMSRNKGGWAAAQEFVMGERKKRLNPVTVYKALLGPGLDHSQYEQVAKEAAERNLTADHALIEFRKPAANGQPGKSWSIGFAGDPTFLRSKEGSVRSYDWWMNEKIWRAIERVKKGRSTVGTEMFAVLIGMGQMRQVYAERLRDLVATASTIILEEYKGPDDYRLYLKYPPESVLSKFSTLILQNRAKDVLNCMAFVSLMFPEIVHCPSSRLGFLRPGLCSGKPPDNLKGPWCDSSSLCTSDTESSEDEPQAKKRRV
jgi:hypothetical protein